MANLSSLTYDGNLKLPAGTTAERPASPEAGQMRYNTDFKLPEYYTGRRWETIPKISENGLALYLDAGSEASAPTGANGTIWKNIAPVGSTPLIPDVDINGRVADWSYSSDDGGVVRNTTVRNGGGIPMQLANWEKMKGTWEFWVKWNGTSYSNGLFLNNNVTSTAIANWFWLGSYYTGGRFYIRIPDSSGSYPINFDPLMASGRPYHVPNEWTQFVCTWDVRGGHSYFKFYVNGGVLIHQGTLTWTVTDANPNTEGSLMLGHTNAGGAQFCGDVAIIRNYNRPLSEQEIKANFLAGRLRYNNG